MHWNFPGWRRRATLLGRARRALYKARHSADARSGFHEHRKAAPKFSARPDRAPEGMAPHVMAAHVRALGLWTMRALIEGPATQPRQSEQGFVAPSSDITGGADGDEFEDLRHGGACAFQRSKRRRQYRDQWLARQPLISVLPPPLGPLEGASPAVPEIFELVAVGAACYVRRRRDEALFALPGLSCRPLDERPHGP